MDQCTLSNELLYFTDDINVTHLCSHVVSVNVVLEKDGEDQLDRSCEK